MLQPCTIRAPKSIRITYPSVQWLIPIKGLLCTMQSAQTGCKWPERKVIYWPNAQRVCESLENTYCNHIICSLEIFNRNIFHQLKYCSTYPGRSWSYTPQIVTHRNGILLICLRKEPFKNHLKINNLLDFIERTNFLLFSDTGNRSNFPTVAGAHFIIHIDLICA